MALVDTRFNSYQPNLTVLASNNVIKLGSVISIDVKSTLSPGKAAVGFKTDQFNVRVPVSSSIPSNFGSTSNVSVYVETTLPFENVARTYKSFNVTETFVNVLEDTSKLVNVNPRLSTIVATSTGQVTMNVIPVVVQEESKIFGYRIPYKSDTILVDINDRNVSSDRKPVRITETYVYISDRKNKSYTATYTADGDSSRLVAVQKLNEIKRVGMQGVASRVTIPVRRTPVVIETKIKPVNVIDDSIAGSGGGGGGAGGGAGVLTEYWS